MPKSLIGWAILIVIAFILLTNPTGAGAFVHEVFTSIGSFLHSSSGH